MPIRFCIKPWQGQHAHAQQQPLQHSPGLKVCRILRHGCHPMALTHQPHAHIDGQANHHPGHARLDGYQAQGHHGRKQQPCQLHRHHTTCLTGDINGAQTANSQGEVNDEFDGDPKDVEKRGQNQHGTGSDAGFPNVGRWRVSCYAKQHQAHHPGKRRNQIAFDTR